MAVLCGKNPSWAHFLDDYPGCKASNSGGESHLGLHSLQEWASVVPDSSLTTLARSWAGLEGRLCGDPAILGSLIWLLGLRSSDPGQWRSLHSLHQGLCMALQEGGKGPRKRPPGLAGPQPFDGVGLGLKGEGLFLFLGGGLALGPAAYLLHWCVPCSGQHLTHSDLTPPCRPLEPGEEG